MLNGSGGMITGTLEHLRRPLARNIKKGQRVLVTAHDAFNYFGRRFDFEVVGIQGISTESEAGVQDIQRLVDLLVDRKIAAGFVESTGSSRHLAALIEGAKAKGHTVAISEPSSLRRSRAAETGVADHVFDPTQVDVVAAVRDLTGGRGADVGFECTSVQPALDTLFDALRPQAVLVVVSIWGHPGTVDMQKMVLK